MIILIYLAFHILSFWYNAIVLLLFFRNMSKQKNQKQKQTYFNVNWMQEEELKHWLTKGTDDNHFGCQWCNQTKLKLGNMGERALRSHMKSDKHKKAKKHHEEIQNFFQKHTNVSTLSVVPDASTSSAPTVSSSIVPDASTSSAPAESSSVVPGASTSVPVVVVDVDEAQDSTKKLQTTIEHSVSGSQVVKAELIWTLTTIVKDFSNNSNEDMNLTFQAMFPDDRTASNFTCGPDKTIYLTNWGIGPWVKEKLQIQINDATYVVVGFDESLNKITQTCQMDLVLRYWDPVDLRVKVRYWDSKFLGHSCHLDLLKHYNDAIMNFDSSKIIQVSMDGPSVNHKFYDQLVSYRAEINILQLMIFIGSCGIHIVHGAFKTAFEKTEWAIKGIIKGCFVILHNTPARRADFITVTSCGLFPLFFCATRWVEDQAPADRLIQIWPNIVKIVKFWLGLPKRKQPSGKSFDAVNLAVKDPLTTAKLSFFSYIASILQPFLTKYQTQKPMIPCLYGDLTKIYKSLLKVIVKDDVVDECTGYQLPKIDMEKPENVKKEKNFNIGFVTEGIINKLKKKDMVTKKQINDFYANVKTCIKALINKLNERCPLNSVVVRNAVVFNPILIIRSKAKILQKKLKPLLQHLTSLKIILASNCDKIISQYASMKTDIDAASVNIDEFPKLRLDDFFFKRIKISKYPELSAVLSLILTLSHGNADVERGFSLNKGVLQDNLKTDSIINKRLVKDHMLAHDLKPYTIEITNELRKSCRRARSRYHKYLDEQRKAKVNETSEAAKEIITMEIEEVQTKISLLEKSKASLNEKFESIVMNTANIPKSEDVVIAINEATALKRKATEQVDEIRKLEETVKTMMEKRSKM